MPYSGTMIRAPWEEKTYRIVTAEGPHSPFGRRLPRYRTRSGMFDDMAIAQIRRLNDAWPQLLEPLQFAVEDVPPSSPPLGRRIEAQFPSVSRFAWHTGPCSALPHAIAESCAIADGYSARHSR